MKTGLTIMCLIYLSMQCAKQPFGSNTCGFYVCEHLRSIVKYCSSWNQLKKAQSNQDFNMRDPAFDQLVNDMCKCIMDDVVDREGKWFDPDSEMATNPKFASLCTWRDSLDMTDYTLPEL